jgi:hypothetical protein
MNDLVGELRRLTLPKGEGRVRVLSFPSCVCRESPHVNPLPCERGEAD